MTIDELQRESWQVAEDQGFHEGREANSRDDMLVRLCLVGTEVSEAAQVVKRHWGKPDRLIQTHDEFADELADILIRVGDLAGCANVDLQKAVVAKMAVNRSRPFKYGTPGER